MLPNEFHAGCESGLGSARCKAALTRAALLATVLLLSDCSASTPTSTDTANTGATSTSPLTTGSASPRAGGQQIGTSGVIALSVEIRTGAETYTVNGKPPEASATDVRYQLSFTDFARQCTLVGGNLVMKVGVQGRIIVGPIGGPGPVDIPLRYAVVQEGIAPRTIATKFKRIGAEVPPGQTNVGFSDVEEDLSFPMPSRSELAGYMVYVGFDASGDAPAKKPPRRNRRETRWSAARNDPQTVQAKAGWRGDQGTEREASHIKIGGGPACCHPGEESMIAFIAIAWLLAIWATVLAFSVCSART